MQLQKLESEMGFPLFERTPQGVVPTPEGKAIYELYQPILLDLQDAHKQAKELQGDVIGEIVFGFNPTITDAALGSTLGQFRRRYPHVHVSIHEATSDKLVDLVESGGLDVALVTVSEEPTPRRRPLTTCVLAEEPLLLAVRRASTEAPAGSASISELASMKLVLPQKGLGFRNILERIARQEGVEIVPEFEMHSTSAVLKLVAESDLATVLPSIALRPWLDLLPLQARSINPEPIRRIGYVHRTSHPLSRASAKFIELLREALLASIIRI
jgi:DNA-binding transcriptional LysR family regulator